METVTTPAKPLERLFRREAGRMLLAGLFAAALLGLAWAVSAPVFMTIDDARLLYVYAGYNTGEPYANYLFCSYFLGWLISGLYRLAPGVVWYTVYHGAVLWLSMTLLGKTLLKWAFRRRVPLWQTALGFSAAFGLVYLYSALSLHFEVTAGLIGAAGAAVLAGMDLYEDSLRVKGLDTALVLLCCFLMRIQQKNSFYAGCCYIALALFYQLCQRVRAKRAGGRLRLGWLAAVLCGVLVIYLGVTAQDERMRADEQWTIYRTYNSYRVNFWDYPHASYWEAPEDYQQAGWSEDFYVMADKMYYMDERFDEESLSRVVAQFSRTSSVQTENTARATFQTIKKLLRTDAQARAQLWCAVLLAAVCGGLCLKKGRRRAMWPELLTAAGAVFGSGVLCVYLGWRGRLPLRAWEVFMLPAISVLLVVALRSLPVRAVTRAPADRKKTALCALLAVALLAYPAWQVAYKLAHDDRNLHKAQRPVMAAMEAYALQHPENIYIYDHKGNQNYNPFTSYPEEKPVNLVSWGGSYLYTPAYYSQLKTLGVSQLYTANFLDENVYFITDNNFGNNLEPLLRLLHDEYGAAGVWIVDMLGDKLTVCKVVTQAQAQRDGLYRAAGYSPLNEESERQLADLIRQGESRSIRNTHDIRQITVNGTSFYLDLYGMVCWKTTRVPAPQTHLSAPLGWQFAF